MFRTCFALSVSTLALISAGGARGQGIDAGAADILVTGQRAAIERSIEAKREAIGVVDVASADDIGRLPDRNVAEVIERLPGVGVTYDQGEGRYVAVRGVPAELNGYTLNGVEIGNPDGLDRKLPLDILAGQLLNRVEVIKVKTADLDGQGIGGAVNLVTQTAFDYREAFNVSASAQVGFQELNDKKPIKGDVSVAARFGSDEQFGIALGGSYSERTYTSYGIYPDDWRPYAGAARGGLPTNVKFTDYSLRRERIGAAGSLDFRPSDDHQVYLRGVYSKFTEDEYRQRYRLDFATNSILASAAARAARGLNPGFVLNPDGLTGTVTPQAAIPAAGGDPAIAAISPERRQDLRLEYKEKSILAGMLGGSSRLGDTLKLDWVVARVHNEVREPNDLWQFRCNPGTVDFDFSERLYTAVPRSECSASELRFRQYSHQNEIGDEDIWQGRADLTWELPALDSGSFVQLGGKYRTTDKTFDASNEVRTPASSADRFPLGDLAGAPVTVYPRSDRGYVNAPTIGPDAIRDYTGANIGGPSFELNAADTIENATLDDFAIEETVWAGYAMANLRFGAITVTPGLRFERTHTDVTGFRLETVGAATNVVSATQRSSYDDWLPSLIVRIQPREDVIVRLAYSRSLGRPNYGQLSPGGALEYEAGAAPGTFEGSFSTGNPMLKPYRADNLDVSAEWYFARGGLLSVGVFAKFIKNPIFTQTTNLTDVDFAGRRYENLSISQPQNAESGDIIGIEAAFQQQFTFLPGLLGGFGIELNGTLIDSNLRLPSGRTSAFPSQSSFLYGGRLFYQQGPVEASLAYHNTGHSLISTGGQAFEDQYNDDLRRLDAKISVAVLPNVSIYGEAQNLTDEPTRQYQGGNPDWLTQEERYGRTFWIGVSSRF